MVSMLNGVHRLTKGMLGVSKLRSIRASFLERLELIVLNVSAGHVLDQLLLSFLLSTFAFLLLLLDLSCLLLNDSVQLRSLHHLLFD